MRRMQESRPSAGRTRRIVIAVAILTLFGAAAGATGVAFDWWDRFTYTFTDNQDGTFNLTVIDENGNVDLDENFANGSEVMHLEGGGYLVVEPDDSLEAEMDAILKELESEGNDGSD